MHAHDPLHPIKDSEAQHPVPAVWRPILTQIVRAFARRDYALAGGVPSVKPVSPRTATQIEKYIAAYGETLTELPVETWKSSVTQWMDPHWEALVDLWTAESGRSDMVLHARVLEDGPGFRFEIQLVYVP